MKYCPSCFSQNTEEALCCGSCGWDLNHRNRKNQLPVNSILTGRYLVGKVLGEGGFGITYAGYDLRLEQPVAIKEYFPSGVATRYDTHASTVEAVSEAAESVLQKGKEKFLSEARTMSRFRELPAVVDVTDFFKENGTAYIIMEYLNGVSMGQYLKQHGTMKDFDTLYAMLRPVMADLAQIHAQGLIHRDISPSNLMLLKNGRMKLLDFGTAREMSEEGEKSLSVVLKPGFAPIEQYSRRGEQGAWTDIYALCATIYKLLTGVTPEVATDRVIHDRLQPPSALGVMTSPQQEKALLQGMAIRREDRIDSVGALMAAFDGVSDSTTARKTTAPDSPVAPPSTETPTRQTTKKKAAGKLGVILGGLAAVAVLLAVFLLRTPKLDVEAVEALLNPTEGAADYAAVLELVSRPAEKGNADAMYYMGRLSEEGNGVEQDYAKAREWYEKAAQQDHADAMFRIGRLYGWVDNEIQDYEKAREWYEKAADLGNAGAMFNLGVMYENGKGVEQDYGTAREWWEKAAELGEAGAMNNLGVLYENGLGVPKDLTKAQTWYDKARAAGYTG